MSSGPRRSRAAAPLKNYSEDHGDEEDQNHDDEDHDNENNNESDESLEVMQEHVENTALQPRKASK